MNDHSFVVRPCEAEDVPAIAAIYRREVLEGVATFETDPPEARDMDERRRRVVAAGFPYLVAAGDDGVAGYAYVSEWRARAAFAHTVENSVYVRHDLRGRGIGRMLLARLVEECAARGFRQMIAVIGDSGNAGSIALHARLGFVHAGVQRAVGWKHGRWLDTVIMQRALGDGDARAPDPRPTRS